MLCVVPEGEVSVIPISFRAIACEALNLIFNLMNSTIPCEPAPEVIFKEADLPSAFGI